MRKLHLLLVLLSFFSVKSLNLNRIFVEHAESQLREKNSLSPCRLKWGCIDLPTFFWGQCCEVCWTDIIKCLKFPAPAWCYMGFVGWCRTCPKCAPKKVNVDSQGGDTAYITASSPAPPPTAPPEAPVNILKCEDWCESSGHTWYELCGTERFHTGAPAIVDKFACSGCSQCPSTYTKTAFVTPGIYYLHKEETGGDHLSWETVPGSLGPQINYEFVKITQLQRNVKFKFNNAVDLGGLDVDAADAELNQRRRITPRRRARPTTEYIFYCATLVLNAGPPCKVNWWIIFFRDQGAHGMQSCWCSTEWSPVLNAGVSDYVMYTMQWEVPSETRGGNPFDYKLNPSGGGWKYRNYNGNLGSRWKAVGNNCEYEFSLGEKIFEKDALGCDQVGLEYFMGSEVWESKWHNSGGEPGLYVEGTDVSQSPMWPNSDVQAGDSLEKYTIRSTR